MSRSGSGRGPIERSSRSFDVIDDMPGPLRACVHEFGFAIVNAFCAAGIRTPNTIRHLVNEVWNGARQPRQRTGRDGGRALDKLDWLLSQNGSGMTGAQLVRLLYANSMVIVPREPSGAMVNASIEATAHMGIVSKTEKHQGRLRAAIKAGIGQFWPHLLNETPPVSERR